MTQGSIPRLIFTFAVPLLIGNFFQQLYNMVDSVVVGQFVSYQALSAVGTAGFPVFMLMSLFMGIGTGATILVSQFIGAQDGEAVQKTVRTANGFLLMSAIPLTIIGIVLAEPIMMLMRVPADVFDMARDYFAVVMAATLANMGYNLNAGILRGMGDSRSPLYFLIASTCVNIVLDLVFVIVFDWGVVGVALATAIAQVTAWVYSIIFIKKRYPELKLRVFSFKTDKFLLKRMVSLGLPLGFNNAIYSLGFMVLQALINAQGSIFMAGCTAAGRVDNFIFLPVQSFGAAATTFAGQNVGANKIDRLNKGLKPILGITLGVYAVMAVGLMIFGKQALGMFTSDPQVIAVGFNNMLYVVPFYWVFNIFNILNCYMNGAGEVRMPTISSLVMFWAVRLPLAYLFEHLWGAEFIYAAYPVSWAVGMIFSGIYFFSGHWRRHYQMRT